LWGIFWGQGEIIGEGETLKGFTIKDYFLLDMKRIRHIIASQYEAIEGGK
jgi:hypothetical protein